MTTAIKYVTATITKSPTDGTGRFELLIHSAEIDRDNERIESWVRMPTTVPVGYEHVDPRLDPLSSVAAPGPILGLQRMRSFTDQPRFVLAVGDAVDRVAEDSAVRILARLDRVVLVEASYRTAVDIRDTADVVIRIYDREADARRAFGLFQH